MLQLLKNILFGVHDTIDEVYNVETRDASPTHLLTTIESFSKLSQHKIQLLESSDFEAGNYNWKVIINLDGGDHISVKLCMVGTSSLPRGWEVNAMFNFFLYNHISNKYLCFRGKTRRFHAIDSEWGFPKLMAKNSFTEPSNGYLSKDKCVFGAEVFVIRNKPLIENVSILKLSTPYIYERKISNFFDHKSVWKSEVFSAGGYTWALLIYPNGNARAKGHFVSIFLDCVDQSLGRGEKVNASSIFLLRSRNKLNDVKRGGTACWFQSASRNWGFVEFIAIDDMRDPNKGYVVDDSCIFEIQISVIARQQCK